jgi:hypothetical protein
VKAVATSAGSLPNTPQPQAPRTRRWHARVVDHCVIDHRASDRLVQAGLDRDLAGEVAVEELPVAGRAQQPVTMTVRVRTQGLDVVDPAPAAGPLSQPEQRLVAILHPAQCFGRQRRELVGQQPDRPNHLDVVDVRLRRDQREAYQRCAPVTGLLDQPSTHIVDRVLICAQGRRDDVLVAVDRHIDLMERCLDPDQIIVWRSEVVRDDVGRGDALCAPA